MWKIAIKSKLVAGFNRLKNEQICIFGYYGWKNTGDDAMVYALLQELSNLYPTTKFAILSRIPVMVPVSVKNKVRFVKPNPITVFREFIRSSIFIIGGGTHIFDYGIFTRNLRILLRLFILLLFAKVFGTKTYLIGNGIGPISTTWGKVLAKLVCHLADYMTVRDKVSYEVLEALGLANKASLAFDLSALVEPEYETTGIDEHSRKESKQILGISITPVFEIYRGDKKKDFLVVDTISKDINRELKRNPKLETWVFNFKGQSKDDDFLISQTLRERLGSSERIKLIHYNPDPRETLTQVRECSVFIGMRYHACLFAYLNNIPLLIIDYHPKCRALAEEIELPDNAIISLSEILTGGFAERLRNLISSPDKFLANLPIKLARNKARAGIKIING